MRMAAERCPPSRFVQDNFIFNPKARHSGNGRVLRHAGRKPFVRNPASGSGRTDRKPDSRSHAPPSRKRDGLRHGVAVAPALGGNGGKKETAG